MREIGELVRDILRGAGMGAAEELAAIKRAWATLSACPSYAEPYRLEEGRLYVRVGSHVWAQEFAYASEAVREEITRKTGVEIKEIIIKVNVK